MIQKKDILRDAKNITKTCGIYFLIKGTDIVYIGQSKNIEHRVSIHAIGKDFNKFSIIKCDKSQLDELEGKYIDIYRPIYNQVIPNSVKTSKITDIKNIFKRAFGYAYFNDIIFNQLMGFKSKKLREIARELGPIGGDKSKQFTRILLANGITYGYAD